MFSLKFLYRRLPVIALLVVFVYLCGCEHLVTAFGIDLDDLKTGLFDLASALGLLMLTFNGIRWLVSERPEDREECKKAIVYILLALSLAAATESLVDVLYCSNCTMWDNTGKLVSCCNYSATT